MRLYYVIYHFEPKCVEHRDDTKVRLPPVVSAGGGTYLEIRSLISMENNSLEPIMCISNLDKSLESAVLPEEDGESLFLVEEIEAIDPYSEDNS